MEKVFEFAAGDDDVVVDFAKACVAESVGEFAADLPDVFAFGGAVGGLDGVGSGGAYDFFDIFNFAADGVFLAVHFDDEECLRVFEDVAFGASPGGFEGEGVAEFHGAGEESGLEDHADGVGGVGHGFKGGGDAGAEGG